MSSMQMKDLPDEMYEKAQDCYLELIQRFREVEEKYGFVYAFNGWHSAIACVLTDDYKNPEELAKEFSSLLEQSVKAMMEIDDGE